MVAMPYHDKETCGDYCAWPPDAFDTHRRCWWSHVSPLLLLWQAADYLRLLCLRPVLGLFWCIFDSFSGGLDLPAADCPWRCCAAADCDANFKGCHCPEMDIQEANTHAWAATPHKCTGKKGDYTSCDKGGCGKEFTAKQYLLRGNVHAINGAKDRGDLKDLGDVCTPLEQVRAERDHQHRQTLPGLGDPLQGILKGAITTTFDSFGKVFDAFRRTFCKR